MKMSVRSISNCWTSRSTVIPASRRVSNFALRLVLMVFSSQ